MLYFRTNKSGSGSKKVDVDGTGSGEADEVEEEGLAQLVPDIQNTAHVVQVC